MFSTRLMEYLIVNGTEPECRPRSACECEESLLWFAWRLFHRDSGLRRERAALCRRRLPDSQVLAHFFEALRPESPNRQQIVFALERAIRFSHLQNFFRRCRPNPRHLLQFFGRRGVDVYRFWRWLFLRDAGREGNTEANNESKEKSDR